MHGLPERTYTVYLGLDVGKEHHHAPPKTTDLYKNSAPWSGGVWGDGAAS